MESHSTHTLQAPHDAAAQTRRWYLLNYVRPSMARKMAAEAVVARVNIGSGSELEVFAPTFVRVSDSDGKIVMGTAPLLYHYVFVKGTLPEVKHLCHVADGFSFVVNHGSDDRYATVADSEMRAFMVIARFYGNRLPCFQSCDVDLEEGDVVEVVKGDFPGLVGTYVPKQRGRTGNLYISVSQSLAAVVYDIRVDYLRVIEFARNSKRAYQQIDAYVPRLFDALRAYYSGNCLTQRLIAPVVVFSCRFDRLKLADSKLDAKLQALLMATFTLLGDEARFNQARERFDRLESLVTNVWTRALAGLLAGVAAADAGAIADAAAMLPPQSAGESKSQKRLRDEFEYYLGGAIATEKTNPLRI